MTGRATAPIGPDRLEERIRQVDDIVGRDRSHQAMGIAEDELP
jgi:hypothetical protein